MTGVSIVIAAWERQALLDRTLESLLDQTVKPHEVIVVDDGSEDHIAVKPGVLLYRIDRIPGARSSSAAKNFGASLATGDFLLFSDHDVIHPSDAVESLLAHMDTVDSERTLLSAMTNGIPGGFMDDKASWDADKIIDTCASSGIRSGHDIGTNAICLDQHCALISRKFFAKIGGYDGDSFTQWGYNGQDFTLSVFNGGGAVDSNIKSVRTGKLIEVYHQWHEPVPTIPGSAHREFRKKHGFTFQQICHELQEGA